MTLNDKESDEISEDWCRSHLTRKAAIAAKKRLKMWLDPDDDVLLGVSRIMRESNNIILFIA